MDALGSWIWHFNVILYEARLLFIAECAFCFSLNDHYENIKASFMMVLKPKGNNNWGSHTSHHVCLDIFGTVV